MNKQPLTPDQELDLLRGKLGYLTFQPATRFWLDTGSARLNSVLGSSTKGLPYGKMFEFSGLESQGKTLLALLLAGLAQADGADVAWVDTEDRVDLDWAKVQGLDISHLYHFYPKIGEFGITAKQARKAKQAGKDGKELKAIKSRRLQTAEELLTEVEAWMGYKYKQNRDGKLYVAIDSVTGFLTEEEGEAGLTGSNMRTKSALATFLSTLCRRWVPLALSYNTIIVFINQLRTSPNVRFGDPNYTTGGRALKYYCNVRCDVRRVKNGRILQGGQIVGLRGIIRNKKNKAGAGSLEGQTCGFKAMFRKNDWRFMAEDRIKKEAGETTEDTHG